VSRATTRDLLPGAAATLAAAGVGSPDVDARLLLAHVLGIEPGRLWLEPEVDLAAQTAFAELVRRRSQREPLQHLTGVAHFRHLELSVGPGVFVPRPETEVMTGWAIDRLCELVSAGREPFAVDLCSGSGAIAAALATETAGVRVAAVEQSPEAAAYAAQNLAGTGAELVVADMADAPADWDAGVDLVVANPPYIPLEAYATVEPEARDHDPIDALFSGADGLDAIRVLVGVAARLLVDGGLLCFEHADLQGTAAPDVVVASGDFGAVRDHRDLTDRPRFVTALRRARVPGPGVSPDRERGDLLAGWVE
jgi:release factor glutamine methyltransferase